MALPSATNAYDELFTRIAFKVVGQPGYKDVFNKGRPLLMALDERKLTWSGSKQIAHRINLGNTAVGGSYAKGATLDITDTVNETWAVYDPAFYLEPIVVFFQDKIKAGERLSGVQGIVETRMTDAVERQQQQLLSHLCASSKAETTDIEPILTYVKATGAAGGLNPSTSGQEIWAAQNVDTVDFSAAGIAKLRKNALNASKGGKTMFDLTVLPQAFYEETLESGDSKVTINQDAKTKGGLTNANLGQMGLSILNRPVIWDSTWTTNQSATCLQLNFDGLHMVTHSKDGAVEPFQSTLSARMDASVGWRRMVRQLTCSDRDIQASLTTVS